ncbi:hypothetical protein EYF80_001041 [Liparis tanakae]|uniref:Uncharacterized protein n=1 Tax=Liparis tanakae TaxID=230148 RepID=A0A4Z2JEM9_9TELE|nr:hypothetical protein EYF80_001041 [Liparis tanakae]
MNSNTLKHSGNSLIRAHWLRTHPSTASAAQQAVLPRGLLARPGPGDAGTAFLHSQQNLTMEKCMVANVGEGNGEVGVDKGEKDTVVAVVE